MLRRFHAIGRWSAAVAALLLLGLFAAAFLIDEPLRRRMERDLNRSLTGYTVRIGSLDFHPIGFSLDLEDATIVQQANPKPPVAYIPRLSASVQWRELIWGRLVADFRIERPVVNINRRQTEQEAKDDVPLDERGWQEAVQEIYPLKINRFEVVDGDFTYTDDGPFRPIRMSVVNVRANNIRNVRSREGVYPSDLELEGMLFDSATLRADGHADFLAVPHAAVDVRFDLRQLDLSVLEPVLARHHLELDQGTMSGRGRLKYAPKTKLVDLEELRLVGVRLDYVHPASEAAQARVARQVAAAAREVSDEASMVLRAARVQIEKSTLGFANRHTNPPYRLFVSDAFFTLTDFSNQPAEKPSYGELHGRFMDRGYAGLWVTFRPGRQRSDFEAAVSIEDTDMRALNDLWRAHGNFDVAEGRFSVYAEVAVKEGVIEGYVKPIFVNLDVYDGDQERGKGVGRKLYERVVGAVGTILENRGRDQVATKTSLSGRIEDPQTSTLDIVVRLVQNAFFNAILPGLEGERE